MKKIMIRVFEIVLIMLALLFFGYLIFLFRYVV